MTLNKANLRDLIAATGLVILLKLDSNHRFFSPCDFVHHYVAIGEFKLELQSGNAQSGSNSTLFSALKFDWWPWKTIGHLSKATSSYMYHFIIIVNSKWSYSPETVKLGCDLCDLDLWPWPFAWTLPWSMVITEISWWYEDGNMLKKVWQTDRQTDGETDGQTDGRTDGKKCS